MLINMHKKNRDQTKTHKNKIIHIVISLTKLTNTILNKLHYYIFLNLMDQIKKNRHFN